MFERTPQISEISVLATMQMITAFNVKICFSWKMEFVGISVKVVIARSVMESVKTASSARSVGVPWILIR